MKEKGLRQQLKGQSMVEFALVLPFLILLFIGMIEVGYAMYDYIVVSNANREGVRLAARGRFTDMDIIDRIIGAGGFREDEDGNQSPLLSTGENFGVIITHIPFPANVDSGWQAQLQTTVCCQPDCPAPVADRVNITICSIGSMADDAGGVRAINAADSHIAEISQYQTDVDVSSLINEWRVDENFNPLMNEIVVVETYFVHSTLLNMPDILSLYFSSSMRVTLNSRNQVQ